MKTCDKDIRKKLHMELYSKFSNDTDTLIIDEFNLCQGTSRIDIIVINNLFHGYEIKSEKDNLLRLPSQISTYSKVMNKMTIVAGENHYNKIKELVPEWWGIKLIVHDKSNIKIVTKKREKTNKNIDAYSVAQLLWREEALYILEKNSLAKGLKSKSKKIMWEKLSTSLSLKQLQYEVILALKNRTGWRVD